MLDGKKNLKTSKVPWTDKIKENHHVAVYRDGYPVTVGHLLFVPKCNTLDMLTDAFQDAVLHGENCIKNDICEGYNIGINVGKSAGQTVDYPHIHLIPRRAGDVEDPVGGVRAVIPGKANYRLSNLL